MRASSSEAGFTLVEVLVALVITALVLGVVVTAITSARERMRDSAETAAAIRIARNQIALASARAFRPGATSGREDGLDWRMTARPADLSRDERGAAWRLVELQLDVARAPGGPVVFEATTRRLLATGKRR